MFRQDDHFQSKMVTLRQASLSRCELGFAGKCRSKVSCFQQYLIHNDATCLADSMAWHVLPEHLG